MKVLHFESVYCRGAYFNYEVLTTNATSLRQFLEEQFYTKDDFDTAEQFQQFLDGKLKNSWQGPGIEWSGSKRCSVQQEEFIEHFLVISDDSVIEEL